MIGVMLSGFHTIKGNTAMTTEAQQLTKRESITDKFGYPTQPTH